MYFTSDEIEGLAKRYRTAYRPRSIIGVGGDIVHGDAVYIFDKRRQARLLGKAVIGEKGVELRKTWIDWMLQSRTSNRPATASSVASPPIFGNVASA